MSTIFGEIENFFKQNSILSRLIIINILVFILIRLAGVLGMLINLDMGFIMRWVELPASFSQMFSRPWTLITYMFTHFNFWHILFNMLWLYWFGKIFLLLFSPKQLGGLYIIGGLAGALFFILAYNSFPYFKNMVSASYLVGASASIMAIVFATAFYKKDLEIGLLFLGNIKIIYLAIIFLIIDALAITSSNAGGHIAHIGGALTGICYAYYIKKGTDITSGLNSIIDKFANLFKKKQPKMKVRYRRFESDYNYNNKKNTENEEIDRILDKIKKSGYPSLTSEEKKKLFDASKK